MEDAVVVEKKVKDSPARASVTFDSRQSWDSIGDASEEGNIPFTDREQSMSQVLARLQRSASPGILRRNASLLSLGSEKSTNIAYTSSSADAYNQYAVVSALIFGFAVNSFTNVAGIVADSDQYTSTDVNAYADPRAGGSAIMIVFCMLLAVVCTLSGYATVFMTLQFYACKILLERAHPDRLRGFLRSTWRPRQLARHSTWAAMALYLSALGVLAFEILPSGAAVVVACVMGAGVLAVVLVWRWLMIALTCELRAGSGRRRCHGGDSRWTTPQRHNNRSKLDVEASLMAAAAAEEDEEDGTSDECKRLHGRMPMMIDDILFADCW